MIDNRDIIATKRKADTEVMLPAGPKIAFTGGLEYNDHMLIWDRRDRVHAKHPDRVRLHGGSRHSCLGRLAMNPPLQRQGRRIAPFPSATFPMPLGRATWLTGGSVHEVAGSVTSFCTAIPRRSDRLRAPVTASHPRRP
jgi:hypothetical protein